MTRKAWRSGPQRPPADPGATRTRPRRRSALVAFVLVAVVLSVGAALASYKASHDREHDLTVIGNGVPTVVQVHDPDCPICRQLQGEVREAARGIGPERLQVRTASLSMASGRAFAYRHGVPHVTLLYFDGGGRLIRKESGPQSSATLRPAFLAHANRR